MIIRPSKRRDELSQAGQRFSAGELRAKEIFEMHNPGKKYVLTGRIGAALVDGVVFDKDQMVSIVETKCRVGMTFENVGKEGFELLIGFEKAIAGRELAVSMHSRFDVFFFLLDDDTLISQPMFDPFGDQLVNFRVRKKTVKANINTTLTKVESFCLFSLNEHSQVYKGDSW